MQVNISIFVQHLDTNSLCELTVIPAHFTKLSLYNNAHSKRQPHGATLSTPGMNPTASGCPE